MSEVTTENQTEELTTPAKPVKVKDRSIEELHSVATKTMSPTEIKKYVDHLRDYTASLEARLKSLKEAFAGVQSQKEQLAQAQQQFQLAAKTQIQFCKDTVAQAYKTLHYMQNLDEIGGKA